MTTRNDQKGSVVDDGKGFGGGKRFQKADQEEDYDSDKSAEELPVEREFETLHFYYNFQSHLAHEASESPLLHEVLEMFKSPSELESAKGLVRSALRPPINVKVQFWAPLLIGVLFTALSLGILSLVLSMDLMDLLFDRTKQLRLRIFVPVGTFIVFASISYLYFCVSLHVNHRKKMLNEANDAFRRTTYEIFQRSVEFKQLCLDHRMMILVVALEPLKEIIFPEEPWDKRGKKHVAEFIQKCKRTIKALMTELDLLDMHRETKLVLEAGISDKFTVDAVAKPPEPEPEITTKKNPDPAKRIGKKDEVKEEKNLLHQQKTLSSLQPEGLHIILECKYQNTRKLLHLDFVFKLYMLLWCLEIGHKGDFCTY